MRRFYTSSPPLSTSTTVGISPAGLHLASLTPAISQATVVTGSLPALTLNTAQGGVLPWTFGHAFRQGDVPSGNFLTSTASAFQADVRNRWPDGSVKYAVLSGRSAAGAITLSATTTAPSGSNIAEPATLDVVVTFTGAVTGSYTLQSCLGIDRSIWSKAGAGRIRQILGPVMSEFHYYRPTTDAHVAVWFYVRVYSDRTEVETVIENGWLNVTSPGEKDYSVTVAVSGTTKFSGSLSHLHHTRWSRVDWIGTDPAITPQHDVSYLRASKMVPNYGYTSPTSAAFTGLASAINPTPFALGNYVADMGGTGDAQPIGVLPHWEALFCTSADSRAYVATVSNARTHGRWQVHFRDETTGRPPLHQSYPNTTILSGWGSVPPPTASGGNTSGAWDLPHHPSVGYLAYLIEGRWEQLEALQFTAAYNLLEGNTATRTVSGYGSGIVSSINAPYTTRGAAWTWRTVGQAAAISPESLNNVTLTGADLATGDSFRTSVQNTATWLKARYVDGTEGGGVHVNSVGWLGQYDQYGAPDGENSHWWGGGWLHNFQLAALAHISDLGIKNVTAATLNAVRDHAYNHVVNLCGTDATWNFRRAGTYAKPYLSNTNPDSPTFLTTAQAFTIYLTNNGAGALSSASGQSLKDHDVNTDMANGSSSSDADGYWSYVIANLSTAVEHSKSGAQAAFDLVTAASNYNPVAHGVNDNPKWGIRSRTSGSLPAFVPAAGQFANISLNTLASIDPCPSNSCPYSGAGTESVFIVWNGGAYAANFGQYGALVCHGGGHLSYSGNAPFVFDLGTRLWSCIGTPSPYTETQADSNGEYPDGRPFPPHTYSGLAYLSPTNGGGTKGSLLRFGFAGSGDNEWVHRCDLATGVWSRWSSTFLSGGSYYSACYDSSRNRHWFCGGYNSFSSGHGYISSSGAVTFLPNLGDNVDGDRHALGYCTTNDMLIQTGTVGGTARLAGRLASGSASFQSLTTSGSFPPDLNAGLEWSTILNCFVSYPGNGSSTVYKLTPPASNPLTSTWVWSTVTLTGAGGATPITAVYTSGFNGHWSRFREVPALRSFVYADGRSNPVQLWRLPGM